MLCAPSQYPEAIAQFRKAAELRPPHTQPQPCKHCVASARQRSSVYSWQRLPRIGLSLLRPDHFLHERFETRIATERIEHRINFDPSDRLTLMIGDTLLEPANCFLAIVQAEIEQRARPCVHVAVPAQFCQFSQHSRGRFFVP